MKPIAGSSLAARGYHSWISISVHLILCVLLSWLAYHLWASPDIWHWVQIVASLLTVTAWVAFFTMPVKSYPEGCAPLVIRRDRIGHFMTGLYAACAAYGFWRAVIWSYRAVDTQIEHAWWQWLLLFLFLASIVLLILFGLLAIAMLVKTFTARYQIEIRDGETTVSCR